MTFELLGVCLKKKTHVSAEGIVTAYPSKSSKIRDKEIVSLTVLWKLTS